MPGQTLGERQLFLSPQVNIHTRLPTSYISLTGITGAKFSNVGDIEDNIDKLRKVSAAPIAVGFGVATPEDAARVSKMTDGVIVGSAIVKRIAFHQQDPAMVGHVAGFVRLLKSAMAVCQPFS